MGDVIVSPVNYKKGSNSVKYIASVYAESGNRHNTIGIDYDQLRTCYQRLSDYVCTLKEYGIQTSLAIPYENRKEWKMMSRIIVEELSDVKYKIYLFGEGVI